MAMFARPKKHSHVVIDQQILRLHTAMAEKVLASPQLFEKLQSTLEERYRSGLMRYGAYLQWHGILAARNDPNVFKSLLLADDGRTASLRRQTIFIGVLTEEERQEVLTTGAVSNHR